MADVATLGLAVDSSQVDKGAKSLDNLSNSAKRAQAAASGVSASTKNAGAAAVSLSASAGQAAASLNSEAAAAQRAAIAMRSHAVAVNDNARRMGGSMSGLAAQFQDIGVTAAMGMNPAIIALQQGTQIAGQMEMAMQSGASAASVLGTAFKSLFSPVTFVTIALTALAAAGLQMVDWTSVASSAMNLLADALEIVAPYAAMAAAGLALLYAPAIIGGLASVTMGVWGLVRALGAAALAFAAANPATAFVLGLTVAVAAANIFRDELTRIFGFDIVGAVKGGVNAIIAAFLGAYDGVVNAWSALPAAFGDLSYQAANKFIEGINWMVGEVVSIVNGLIAKINGGLRGAVERFGGDAANAVQLNDLGSPQSYKLGGIENPYSGAAAGVSNTFSEAIAARQGVDYIGAIGGAITNMASGAADKLRGLASSFGGVGDAAEEAGGAASKAAKDATDPWKGLRTAVDTAGEGMRFVRDLVGGFVSDLRSGLEQGKGFWRSFADAALNALDKIVDKLLNDVLDALFQVNNAGTGMGGGGGILGSLFGSLFGGGGFSAAAYAGIGQGLYAKGGVFDQSGVTAFAKGGVVNTPTVFPFAKGIGLMGEAGPEAIMPLRRGPDGRLGVAANDRAANQNGPQQININVNVDGANGDQHVIALVQEGVSRGLSTYDKSLPDRLNAINRNPRRR